MDTIRLSKYREKLLCRRHQVLTAVEHLEREKEAFAGEKQFEWLDQARDETELQLLDRLSETYLREMGRIEAALERMSTGSYGLCFACHRPIEKGRLETFPDTAFCLDCKEMREELESL